MAVIPKRLSEVSAFKVPIFCDLPGKKQENLCGSRDAQQQKTWLLDKPFMNFREVHEETKKRVA